MTHFFRKEKSDILVVSITFVQSSAAASFLISRNSSLESFLAVANSSSHFT